MGEQVSCINYKIILADDIGNEVKVDKICIEKEMKGKQIVYFARLFICIKQKDNQFCKEYYFELDKLHNWLYSMYSVGVDRNKSVKMEVGEDIIIKMAIISDKEAKLEIENKKENFDFQLVASIQKFREFQSAWKRAVAIL